MYILKSDQAPDREGSDVSPLQSLNILLVEDCFDQRRLYARILVSAGATVQLECNGQSALEMIERRHGAHDVVVCDFQMPIVDGVEMTRLVRERGHDLPILGLTAYLDAELRQEWMESGCDLILEKPVKPARLISAVLDAAAKRRSGQPS